MVEEYGLIRLLMNSTGQLNQVNIHLFFLSILRSHIQAENSSRFNMVSYGVVSFESASQRIDLIEQLLHAFHYYPT